jgi:hypothetical protein
MAVAQMIEDDWSGDGAAATRLRSGMQIYSSANPRTWGTISINYAELAKGDVTLRTHPSTAVHLNSASQLSLDVGMTAAHSTAPPPPPPENAPDPRNIVGTPEWLRGNRIFYGPITQGSVGIRATGVEGETVGESLLFGLFEPISAIAKNLPFGLGDGLDIVDREAREANVRENVPIADMFLQPFGEGLFQAVDLGIEQTAYGLMGIASGGTGMLAMQAFGGRAVVGIVASVGMGGGLGYAYGGFSGSGGITGWDQQRANYGAISGGLLGLGGFVTAAGMSVGSGVFGVGATGAGFGGMIRYWWLSPFPFPEAVWRAFWLLWGDPYSDPAMRLIGCF